MINKKKIEEHFRGILVALGENPDREGLQETPKRVAKAYSEIFDGLNYTNEEIASIYDKGFTDEDIEGVLFKLKQTLAEIKEIAEKRNYLDYNKCLDDILQKISEYEVEE